MTTHNCTPIPDGFKRCPDCGVVKPVTEFYRNKATSDGYKVYCKLCSRERDMRFREANPDYSSEYGKRWYADHRDDRAEWYKANAETQKARSKDSYYRHHEKRRATDRNRWAIDGAYRARNTEHQRTRQRTPEGKAYFTAASHRYRARKLTLPDTFTAEDWTAALSYFDHRCAVCGRPVGLWHTLAADHWIPVTAQDCPGTVPWNIVPLCHGNGGCNNSKSNRLPDKWLIDTYGKRKGNAILKRIETWLEKQRC